MITLQTSLSNHAQFLLILTSILLPYFKTHKHATRHNNFRHFTTSYNHAHIIISSLRHIISLACIVLTNIDKYFQKIIACTYHTQLSQILNFIMDLSHPSHQNSKQKKSMKETSFTSTYHSHLGYMQPKHSRFIPIPLKCGILNKYFK